MTLAISAGAVAGQAGTGSAAPSQGQGFVKFDDFLSDVSAARYDAYAAQDMLGEVRDTRAFDEMRSYILSMYRDVKVTSSFVWDDSHYDCVTVDSQPSIRELGITTPASPPTPETAPGADTVGSAHADSITMMDATDRFGNSMSCADGTIPMQRISLDRMSGFATVDDFLAKQPDHSSDPGINQPSRHYAYGNQSVNNHGGSSHLNLWNPTANFSISQQWYSAGSGSGLQTVEGGWIKYPSKFGSNSVLFIFYTPNNYASGCYNLDCTGFVQTSSNWTLGAGFTNYSTTGGTQWEFQMQWQLSGGNWWLFLAGSGSLEAVGYYPASIYGNGPITTQSTRPILGGETAPSGSTWPQMGSGAFASAGWQNAAYQRRSFYINTANTSVWSSLSPVQTAPSCYTIAITPSSSGGDWGTYFFFGGPGGTNC